MVVRVLDVPSAATLPELHELLQAGIGWTDSHLHQFITPDIRYGVVDPDFVDFDPGLRDENTVTLRDLPARFSYDYDFGDSWEHDIEDLGPGGPVAGCVDGEGACPPEDCGGVPGYAEFREAIAEPRHPEHHRLRAWAGSWVDRFDREATDALVRDTAGQIPESVRILLDLLAGGVKLTPGGRLPRVVVRQVHAERPNWYDLGRPAQIEEDLPPLVTLHELLRKAGLARLSRGILSPTKAAADDLQIVRRLRTALEPGSFHELLISLAAARLAAEGPATGERLAGELLPWLRGWAVDGKSLTEKDLRTEIYCEASTMDALDLAARRWTSAGDLWEAGPSATSLLPRATALAHDWHGWDGEADDQGCDCGDCGS